MMSNTPDLELVPSEPEMLRVIVENFVGQHSVVRIRKAATILQLKKEIESKTRVQVANQTLIRRVTGNPQAAFTQLDDAKTLDHYNVTDGERIMLVPNMRSAPPGHGLVTNAPTTRIFLDPDGKSEISAVIDRALAEKNQKRDPKCVYFLAQLAGQPQGTLTVVQFIPKGVSVSRPTRAVTEPISADLSDSDKEQNRGAQSQMSHIDHQQNVKTRSIMDRIRAKIRKMKRAKAQSQKSKTKKSCSCKSRSCTCDLSSASTQSTKSDESSGHKRRVSRSRKAKCNVS